MKFLLIQSMLISAIFSTLIWLYFRDKGISSLINIGIGILAILTLGPELVDATKFGFEGIATNLTITMSYIIVIVGWTIGTAILTLFPGSY